ncbi:diaminopimelate epimerase [Anaerosinus massiliensis]|uniref:diaminopimelate epimerase n=1 Tax=Massilibacillus massiliensis TaxID=1806837 RepID=UPI000A6FBE04|nr:diaminopimelate epimerase [Massilibacillus massiliensis]
MKFYFSKWHGIGNDFIIVDGSKEQIEDYHKTALEVCDRHFGIGADGLVMILPSEIADFKMRIFNSDGSEAEMCGNATRCIARYLYEEKLTLKTKISIETKAGIIKPELIFKNGKFETVKVDMGEPILKAEDIPVSGFGKEEVIHKPLTILDKTYDITCVSMGNPHCVIFVEDINEIDLEKIGPMIETAQIFPRKINVEFVEVKNKDHLRMRVWERGAGITLACGTGSCATIVAAILNKKIEGRSAKIELDGGDLFVEWGVDQHVYLSGPAEEVFRGNYIK